MPVEGKTQPPKMSDPLIQLPPVRKIQGISLELPNGKPRILLQYTDQEGHWHEIPMHLADGIYLLLLLQQMEGLARSKEDPVVRESVSKRLRQFYPDVSRLWEDDDCP